MAETAERQWSGKTDGGNFGQRFLLTTLRSVPVRAFYPALGVAVPFYCIVNHKAFGCIKQYFHEIQHFSKWKSFWKTIQNHFIFGKVVLDRFAILAGNSKQFKIEVPNNELFVKLLDEPNGFIVAGSHIGNFELLGHFFNQDKKFINIVVYDGENANLQSQRRASFLAHNVKMIPVREDLSHIFAIKEALDHGEIVAIVCDRVFGSAKTLTLDFLDRPAEFPLGTFVLAAQMECPVAALVAMKERGTHYRGFVKVFEQPTEKSNIRSRSKLIAEQYTDFLATVLQQYPEQWFNFYDFWHLNS